MSLLLDALKKAAEQKAEKSKEIQAEARTSDETVLNVGASDIPLPGDDADSGRSPPRHGQRDETELDHSELETRLEQTRVERDADDETGLEVDATDTRVPDPSAQMQTGEDETIIFADEDVSEFMGGPGPDQRAARDLDDETDLSQLPATEDATGPGRVAAPADETDLSQLQERDEETDFSQRIFNEDETEFKERIFNEEETELRVPPRREDETDISIPPANAASEIDPGQAQAAPAADETDLSQPGGAIDSPADDDMSLLLVERDDTNLTGSTSVTDPQVPGDSLNALRSGPDDEALELVDTTRHQIPADATSTQATTQSNAATTSVAMDTQSTTEGTTARAEATSTRTYAPDNYDRTLMKLPSDDASRLFAGMKSDADVVMTPDYAKKVFQSKSSAQRLQHYRFYAVIAFMILLGIGVYGLFEMQDESNQIQNSLRPLKQDPMPGVIRPDASGPSGLVLNVSEVDAKTLELVASANSLANQQVASQGVVASDNESPPPADGMQAPDSKPANASASSASGGNTALTGSFSTPQPDSRQSISVAKLDSSPTGARATSQAGGGSLQISRGSRVEEKHAWLREAYAAYLAGNDDLALLKYNQVLEVDPWNRNALLARAAIYIQNNNSAAAIADYQTLLLANPKDSLAMTSLLSVTSYSPRDAESQLKLMLRDEPNSPYLNFALANAYGAQNRWQEAQAHYFIALENNPRDPNYAYNLAVSLEHIAKPAVAIAYYQRALENFNNGLATFNRDVVDQRLETLRKL